MKTCPDAASRGKNVEDWCLSDRVFRRIVMNFGTPDVDLMATTSSRKAPYFYSWNRADTEALALDALSPDIKWAGWTRPYLFPPFSLIPPALAKIKKEELKSVIMVVPWWPGKPWWTTFTSMLILAKRLPSTKVVVDLTTGLPPPGFGCSRLVACTVTGRHTTKTASQSQQRSSLTPAGETAQNTSMGSAGGDGLHGRRVKEYNRLPLI